MINSSTLCSKSKGNEDIRQQQSAQIYIKTRGVFVSKTKNRLQLNNNDNAVTEYGWAQTFPSEFNSSIAQTILSEKW